LGKKAYITFVGISSLSQKEEKNEKALKSS